MPKPISHRKYLKRLAELARILRSRRPAAVLFTMISRATRYQDLFEGICEHLDAYCRECMLEDESCDCSSDDGSRYGTLHVPDEEGVLLAAGLEWIRLSFPDKRTVEVLMDEALLCKALRSVVMKYHPKRLPHEAEMAIAPEMNLMLNQALDRLWPALRDYVPVPPPSRAAQPRPT